jgi:hypothetical protein
MATARHPALRSFPAVPRAFWRERFGPAIISGFVATTAMAVAALVGYAFALGFGSRTGGTFVRWLYALTHNPVTDVARSALLVAIGLNFAAGIVWALVFACDANDRLLALPGWARGVVFALPPYVLSLVLFLPLVGGGLFGAKIGAGPLPVIGNLILHLVYGATLGAMFALDGSLDRVGGDTPEMDAQLRRAETGAAYGVILGALVGGGASLLGAFLLGASPVATGSATIGGAVVGAALGIVFGSMASLTGAVPTNATAERAEPQTTAPAG